MMAALSAGLMSFFLQDRKQKRTSEEIKQGSMKRNPEVTDNSVRAVHPGDALQVGDLALQGLDVSEGLSLVLLLGPQGEGAAVHLHGVQPGQLILQLSFGLLAALQEGLNVRRAQQLVRLLILQLLDPIPPADTRCEVRAERDT